MPNVVICALDRTLSQLETSPVWRKGLERHMAKVGSEAASLAAKVKAAMVVVDRDAPGAEALVASLRNNQATQRTSIVVVASGDHHADELGLLNAGANAVLRLPAGPEWEERIERLLQVPTRKHARMPVRLTFEGTFGSEQVAGFVLNVSVTGMLVDCGANLAMGDELTFAFQLHGIETHGGDIRGKARVVRMAGVHQYGVEFSEVADAGREVLRRYTLVP